MIFVTVGTHEQQFDRLISYVDELKGEGIIKDEVFIQIGFSTYEPKHCQWSRLIPYNEMIRKVEEARIIITHGGPASFLMPLQKGKIPIVVPRQAQYDEHVNNHQLEFAEAVFSQQKNIILIENIQKLKDAILGYEDIARHMYSRTDSNNRQFNASLEELVENLLRS